MLAGVLQWCHERTSPTTTFNLTSANSGACASFVGRPAATGRLPGDPVAYRHWCMKWATQWGSGMCSRTPAPDRSWSTCAWTRWTHQARQQPADLWHAHHRRLRLCVHHALLGTSFPASGDRVTLETKAPASTSAAAVLILLRTSMRCCVSTAVHLLKTTVTSNPPGLSVMVDGVAVTPPATFDWPIGSVHRVWAGPVCSRWAASSLAFGRWSHDASPPSRQLTWQVTPGDGSLGNPTTAPSSATVLTANFVRLINVTATPEVQTGGTSGYCRNAWPGTTHRCIPQFSRF